MSAERWQECPVCKGRGDVPWDFYAKMAPTSAVDPRTRCRTCWGATVLDTLVDRDDCPTCRRLIEATMAEMERDERDARYVVVANGGDVVGGCLQDSMKDTRGIVEWIEGDEGNTYHGEQLRILPVGERLRSEPPTEPSHADRTPDQRTSDHGRTEPAPEDKIGLMCMWCYASEREMECSVAPHGHHTIIDGDRFVDESEPAPGVEPELWLVKHERGHRYVTSREPTLGSQAFDQRDGWSYVPLYAHPPTDTGAREALVRSAYLSGYEQGHQDTCETGYYNPEERAEDFLHEEGFVTPETPSQEDE